jgi:hypothetical protein
MTALALLLVAAASHATAAAVRSWDRDFGGPCCLPGDGRPPAGFDRLALQAVAAVALESTPISHQTITVVAPGPLKGLATDRAWKWAPSTARLRTRWRPGAELPFLLLELEKGAFRDREGHPALLVGSIRAVVKSARPATPPVDPDELQGGATAYCVSALPSGPRVAIDHTAEN